MDPKKALAISLIITLAIASNFYIFGSIEESKESEIIKRTIDGDTLELVGGEVIRLENINTPERGEYGYNEAKSFLKRFENQTIEIQRTGLDKYRRTLAKVYTPEYLNLEIVSEGFAKKYLVDDSEREIFANAEEEAIKNEKGLWKKSEYFYCISSEIFPKKELVVIENSCDIAFKNMRLTDESRKKFNIEIPPNSELSIYSKEGDQNEANLFLNAGDIWDNDKDTIYLFDSNNNLVHYHSYGY